MAKSPSQDGCFDVTTILVAVADQESFWVAGKRECDEELCFAASFQSEIPAVATINEVLNNVALLIALDREDTLIVPFIGVMVDRPFKGCVESLQTILEDVVETDQQWRMQISGL